MNQYLLGGGFPFPIVLLPRYKFCLCHTPIKPDLCGFPGIGVRFILVSELGSINQVIYHSEIFVSC